MPLARSHSAVVAAFARGVVRFVVLAALLALGITLTQETGAASGVMPSRPFDPASPAAADCRLAILVRQALSRDQSLAVLNIGVSVRHGVATLWGTVSCPWQAERAAAIAGQVPGIAAVHEELRIEPDDRTFAQGQSNPAVSVPSPRQRPDAHQDGQAVPQWAGRMGVVMRAGTGSWPTPLPIMPVIPLPAADVGRGTEPAAVLLPPLALASGNEVAAAVERLRRAEGRYGGVRVSVTGGVVRLGGDVTSWEDIFELAHRVSRLRGVERVLLDGVRTPANSRPAPAGSP
jgi:osmotically-inducible protein OsmY